MFTIIDVIDQLLFLDINFVLLVFFQKIYKKEMDGFRQNTDTKIA